MAVDKGPTMSDLAQPNDSWSSESRHLFEKLQSLEQFTRVAEEYDLNTPKSSKRFIARCDYERTGRFFNYAMFFSAKKRQLLGVVEFGAYTEGVADCAHGGAVAVMCDVVLYKVAECCGLVINDSGLTANMHTDYRRPIRLRSTYLLEGALEKIEGRKVLTSCRILSPDRQFLHVEATSLIIIKLDQFDTPHAPESGSKL